MRSNYFGFHWISEHNNLEVIIAIFTKLLVNNFQTKIKGTVWTEIDDSKVG
jgi:hypothetical protein